MAPFNKTRKFGKPSFGPGPKKFGSGPRKFGAGPRPSGGPKRFGGGGGYRRPEGGDFERPRFDKQLFQATCASCGNSCEVPFRPSGEKPVYCRDCFRKQEGDGPARAPFRRDDAPRPLRPAFRRPDAMAGPSRNPDLEKELERINVKLDRIIRALEGN